MNDWIWLFIILFSVSLVIFIPFFIHYCHDKRNKRIIERFMDHFLFEFDNRKFIGKDNEIYVLVKPIISFFKPSLRPLDKMEIRRYVILLNYKRNADLDKSIYTKKEWELKQKIYADKLDKLTPFCDKDWLEENRFLFNRKCSDYEKIFFNDYYRSVRP